jgi:hypothetical protein
MLTEKNGFSINGYLAFFIILPLLQVGFGFMLFKQIVPIVAVIASLVVLICWAGFLWCNL